MDEIQKICDLELTDDDKIILTLCIKPRSIADVAAMARMSYSNASQKIMILESLEYIKKIRTMGGKTVLMLNNKKVEP